MPFRQLSLLPLLALAVLTSGCAAAVVVGGATAVVAAHDRRTLGAQIDDQNIEVRIAGEIRADATLANGTHVNVTSYNGVVLLTGEAPTPAQRDKVLALSRAIPGVRRTVNEIRAAEPSESASRSRDNWITTKVRARLFSTRDLDSVHIKVVTESGTVYLMGLVRKNEADLATEAARAVEGVERVVKLFESIE